MPSIVSLLSLRIPAACGLLLLSSLELQAWRSDLYPESWSPPESASFYTDQLIQDFSYAGYKSGEEPVPTITGPVIDAVAAHGADPTGTTDSTAAIQAAIDAAATAGGGVVQLAAGTYRVAPVGSNNYALRIQNSNIVLRGAGSGQTYILNTSYEMRSKSVIRVASPSTSTGSQAAVTSDLEGPTRRIPVADVSGFSVGDFVQLQWDFTPDWVSDHSQESWWGGGQNPPSSTQYLRQVTAVSAEEKWIGIDVPTRYTMRLRDNAGVRTVSGLLTGVGIEELSVGNVQHPGSNWGEGDYTNSSQSAYDAHASWLVRMQDCYDSWIRDVDSFQTAGNSTTCHMLSNGILVLRCYRISVSGCEMRRSQYGGGGGNGYMFRIQSSQENLIQDCVADFSRHGFVISHQGTSGNVFLRCEDRETKRSTGSTGSYTTSGQGSDNHMLFSHSNLWDRCHAHNSFYEARHRGNSGSTTKHGLTSAHAVFWNTSGSGTRYNTIVESEQGRYGYVIGTSGDQNGATNPTGGNTSPADILEGLSIGDTLEPQSLYADQLAKRMHGVLVDAGLDAEVPFTEPYSFSAQAYTYGTGPISYTWTQIGGPSATIADPSSPTTTVTFSDTGTYVFSLSAQDSAVTVSDEITLHAVQAVYSAPLAAADTVVGRSENEAANPLGYFTSSSNATVGGTGSSGTRVDSNVIYRYQLPTLPPGEIIRGFSMTFQISQVRDQSDDDYELDVYLLNVMDPTTTGSSLFYHGASDASHPLIGSHVETSGSNSGSISLNPPVSVTLTVDSGPALALLQSFYNANQPNRTDAAFRFNLDQLYPDLGSLGLNRYVLNHSGASAMQILTMPGSFDEWAAAYSLGDQAAIGDDPDADGIANIVEAWLGTDPTDASSALSNLRTDGTVTTFLHPRNPLPPGDLSALYQWSPDLISWYGSSEGPVGGATVEINSSSAGRVRTVTATADTALPATFLRILVVRD